MTDQAKTAETIREFHDRAVTETELADADVARASAKLRSALDDLDAAIEQGLAVRGSVSGKPFVAGDADDLVDATRRRQVAYERVAQFQHLADRGGVALGATITKRRDELQPGDVFKSSHGYDVLVTEIQDDAEIRSDDRHVGIVGHLHGDSSCPIRTERYPAGSTVEVYTS